MAITINKGAVTSGENISFWIRSVKPVEYQSLKENRKTDVLIGSGETRRTTAAHIKAALDERYYDIENVFGVKGSRIAAERHTAAIEWIGSTVKNENIYIDTGDSRNGMTHTTIAGMLMKKLLTARVMVHVFQKEGVVINSPAVSNLERINIS